MTISFRNVLPKQGPVAMRRNEGAPPLRAHCGVAPGGDSRTGSRRAETRGQSRLSGARSGAKHTFPRNKGRVRTAITNCYDESADNVFQLNSHT